jgi:tetratricopeptide (TPR) repeat protein
MKTKLTVSFLLGLLTLAFVYNNTTEITEENFIPGPGGSGDNFLIGAFNSAFDFEYEYDSLQFNIWHTYGYGDMVTGTDGRHYRPGWQHWKWAPADSLYATGNDYVGQVNSVLSGIPSDMKAYLTRPKIEWLRFGQRSDYQCEDTIYVNPDLWFYAFNDHIGHTVFDNGDTVQFCTPGNTTNSGSWADNPGFVVKRLKANGEQGLPYGDAAPFGDNECKWFIKPRIRIDSTVAHNSGNTNVCKIIVLNNDGDTIKNLIIKAVNFINPQNGQYNGQYLEEFFFGQNDSVLAIQGKWGTGYLFESRGTCTSDPGNLLNKADIQVYWYGNCDMWIDYVRVDNDIADELLNPNNPNHERDSLWLEWEGDIASGSNKAFRYYIELFEFNNIPCMEYIFRKLDTLTSGNVTLVAAFTPHLYAGHVPWRDRYRVMTTEQFKRNFLDRVGAQEVMIAPYPFTSAYRRVNNQEPDPYTPTWSKIPETLENTTGPGVLAEVVSPTEYDRWLQGYLDSIPYSFESPFSGGVRWTIEDDPGFFRYMMQFGDKISKETGLPFIFHTSAHSWYLSAGSNVTDYSGGMHARAEITGEVQREPTNEELDLISNISLTYGSKGLMWFEMLSLGTVGNAFYSRGILDPWQSGNSTPPRYENIYGQQKWNKLIAISARMKAWEPYIMSFNNDDRKSYICRLEREDLIEETYFWDVVSYIRGTGVPPCQSDAPDTTDAPAPEDLRYECYEERYLQVATFKKSTDDGNEYFMVVNRRCSPIQSNHNDGERFVRVFFDYDSPEFQSFNNWSIVDIGSGNTIAVVNNTYYHPYADLGWFAPGEGRLYQMVPTMKHGGTLVTNEDVSGQTFTCLDTVYNGGYNITIDSGTTVSFTDSATIIMTGGTFTSGVHGEDNLTTYKGLGSANWNGLRFEGSTVKIYNSKFQDIASPIVNYAVSMVDCPLADIRTNEFVLDTDTAGAVQSVYIEPAFPGPVSADLYINYNTITMNQSRGNGIAVQGFSALTLPVYIMNNTMSSDGYATGLMLSTITGGAVKKNTITGFSTGVNVLFSSVDLYGNIISNTSSGSKGIMASGSSSLGLVPVSGLWLGGFNEITNTSGASTNIEVDNSIFILDGGNNSFDISTGNNHLYGSFWDDAYPANHRYNCFSVSGTDISSPTLPNDFISSGESEDVTLTYLAYTCGGTPPTGTYIADIGNGLYDTIQSSSEGPGGGGKTINNNKSLPLDKGEKQRGSLNATTPSAGGHPSLVRRGAYVLSPSQLYDSARVNMRKRNYANVKTFCQELINNYPSSHEALSSLQPLYISWMAVDTTQSGVTALKTFYETLILNNGQNTSLVRISNYLVQKCKVSLGSYTSALSGFEQIINNNPYSYEGLLARWDYMATSLLAPSGGSHSSMDNEQLSMFNSESDKSYESEESDESAWGDDDKSPFTKQQKQDIYKSVNTAFEITRNDDEVKIKTLETASENGNEEAAHELAQMKTLKEVIKSEKPKTMIEHIRIVSSDVQKVFGNTVPVSNIKGTNLPLVFSLAQNFPNPFNPVTTIKYALPKDVKVVIKIYDILGREVRTLVNEFRKAGYYDVKFDMSSYASGVYFYRIEAGDFVQSKKMVLVK